MIRQKEYHAEDRISQLPDEVLVSILSCIPINEAARTSVLSHRWEKLWTFCSHLVFDGAKRLYNIQCQIKGIEHIRKSVNEILDIERGRYINWVNHILESCHAGAIDKFMVRFDLSDKYRGEIDEWVRFAFEKKVKRFELDLSSYNISCYQVSCYPLTLQALPLPSSISLTSLILKCVNVNEEVLENIISNSPFLECLSVGDSSSLVHLRVAGPALCLKYVEIVFCFNLESLELHAPNLLSLKYSGAKTNISFVNIPNLVEISLGGEDLPYFARKLCGLSTHFSKLQMLELDVLQLEVIETKMERLKYPIFSQLKQLKLHVDTRSTASLLFFSRLIKACPSLYRLALELKLGSVNPSDRRKMVKARSRHYSLKVVEVTGFVGQTVDTEFCIYLIKSAIMLEKIIIKPCFLDARGSAYENDYVEVEKAGRERAEQLRSKYCLGDKLVIL